MLTYTDVLKHAQQLTPADQERLRQALAGSPEHMADASAASRPATQLDPMLAFIGSIDEEPLTTDDLDQTVYG